MDTQTVKLPDIEGSFFPIVNLSDHEGKEFNFNRIYATSCVFFYLVSAADPACLALMNDLNERYELFLGLGFKVKVVLPESIEVLSSIRDKLNLKYSLFSDEKYILGKKLGTINELSVDGNIITNVTRTTVLVDGSTRVRKVYRPLSVDHHIFKVVNNLYTVFPDLAVNSLISSTAPVLCLPKVLNEKLCSSLINNFKNGKPSELFIEKYMKSIDNRLIEYVLPQLEKAFVYKATRREEPYILKSTVNDSNKSLVATSGEHQHRKFAVVIYLNSEEFSGGGIQFPEYGFLSFKPNTGDALIFSASFYQVLTQIYQGERWIYGTYLYNEARVVKASSDKPNSDEILDPQF